MCDYNKQEFGQVQSEEWKNSDLYLKWKSKGSYGGVNKHFCEILWNVCFHKLSSQMLLFFSFANKSVWGTGLLFQRELLEFLEKVQVIFSWMFCWSLVEPCWYGILSCLSTAKTFIVCSFEFVFHGCMFETFIHTSTITLRISDITEFRVNCINCLWKSHMHYRCIRLKRDNKQKQNVTAFL